VVRNGKGEIKKGDLRSTEGERNEKRGNRNYIRSSKMMFEFSTYYPSHSFVGYFL
jgi:hypothetical protein